MSQNDDEIVSLIIDAQNLATDELIETSEHLEKLGEEAIRTEKSLKKLEVKKDVLDSYEAIRKNTLELRKEVADAEVSYEKLSKETKKNKKATDEQRTAVKTANIELKAMRRNLTSAETDYRKITAAAKEYGVNSKTVAKEQQALQNAIKDTAESLDKANKETKEQQQLVAAQVEGSKRLRAEYEKQKDILAEVANEEEKAAASAKKKAIADKDAKQAAREVTDVLKVYEIALDKLNQSRKAGNLTAGNYIRAEARLRNELKLTEKQVKATRQAVKADSDVKKRAAANTDLLTTSTRRLAQAYTVMLAAQKAIQAVSTSVTNYGELEKAITSIEKTTGNARVEMEALAEQMSHLSEDVTPASTNELLRFGEVAGQLGVKSSADILRVVAAADALGVSTNLAGDEAATLLTRILKMTGEGVGEIDGLASSVVALGNNFAVAEDEIVHMTKEIATGTTSINLGSAANAAFGATLKETGQQAERSRTAMFKLSQAIKSAVQDGGSDLERLSEISGMTGDEIEKSLGEKPEEVLLNLVKGFGEARDEGSNLADILGSMGINGSEAVTVIEALAKNSDRLEEALNLSNDAYQKQNAHMIEAAKAYADQEARITRLGNKFKNLTARIGETFSDETDAAIRMVNDSLDKTSDEVVELFNLMADLGEGVGDVVDVFENLGATFSGTDEQVGLLDLSIKTLRFTFNQITAALNTAVLGLQGFVLAGAEAVNFFNDNTISTEFVDGLRAAMRETKADIEEDLQDIKDAQADYAGTSSSTYRDLRAVIDKYRDSIGLLSAEEQAAIVQIERNNVYVKDQSELYVDLTKALVRKNAETETEAAMTKRLNDSNASLNSTLANGIAHVNQKVESTKAMTVVTTEYATTAEDLEFKLKALEETKKLGLLTDQEYLNSKAVLAEATIKQADAELAKNEILKGSKLTTEEYLKANEELNQQRRDGTISIAELITKQDALTASYELALPKNDQMKSVLNDTSVAQKDLSKAIALSEERIRNYTKTLGKAGIAKQESADITAKLRVEEEALSVLKREQIELTELEGSTYPELIRLREQYTIQLTKINAQFAAGKLTKGEYDLAVQGVNASLEKLNEILGVNTVETDKNTESTKKATAAKKETGEASKEAATYISLEASAASHLNKQYDATGKSVDELSARYRELEGFIQNNSKVSSRWMKNLADISDEVFNQEQAFIDETLTLRKWEEQVNSGTLSLDELGKIASDADRYLTHLSQNQMDGLRDSIKQATKEFQRLDEAINDSLDDAQDRFDRAMGNEEALLKRQHAREIAELEALLKQAEIYNDSAQIAKIKEAINRLTKAQKAEANNAGYDNYNSGDTFASRRNSSNSSNSTSVSGKKEIVYTVNLNSPQGNTQVDFADKDSANKFVNYLDQLGEVNINR